MYGFGNVRVGSFTSLASKADVNVCIGRIPDVVLFFDDISATNPKSYIWFNSNTPFVIQVNPGAVDTAIALAGTNTKVTDAMNQYLGGDSPTSTNVTNKLYVDDMGVAIPVGTDATSTGFFVDDTVQVNSGKAVWVALFNER